MAKITQTRMIAAPVEKVFATVSEIENYSKAIPHITNVEMLSDVKAGVGAKFRETRLMNGKEAKTVLEVTEYAQNESVRLVSDEGGVVWDSVFTTKPADDGTELTLEMEARPHKFIARLMAPIMMSFVGKAVGDDMDAVKAYCEGGA